MGTGLPEILMKERRASHRTSFDLEEYFSQEEHRPLQYEWTLIFPQVQLGGRAVTHKVENHAHQKNLML